MPDTLTVDTSLIAGWLRSGDYDYARQLARPERNWLQEFGEWLFEQMWKGQHAFSEWTLTQIVGFVVGVVIMCVAVFCLYRNRYRWAGGFFSPAVEVDYDISEDNIYGMDFDAALDRALTDENYAEALRVIYLRRLRRLSDAGKIEWKPQCTPDTYVFELPPGSDRESLRCLTAAYVRSRFGHYSVSREQVENLLSRKGGAQ